MLICPRASVPDEAEESLPSMVKELTLAFCDIMRPLGGASSSME
jgi:hypothetical protein